MSGSNERRTPPGVDPAVLVAGGLRYDVSGVVATITLDRPERKNAQTPATWQALAIIGGAIPPEVRVVVVRGAGDVFSSGLDRRMLEPPPEGRAARADAEAEHAHGTDPQGTDPHAAGPTVLQLLDLPDGEMAESIAAYQEGFTWLRRPEVISIAVVRGAAVGAGFQLALACDLRVVGTDARFSMREPLLGLVPDLTGTKPLVDLVGYSRALEICATTRWVMADEAREIGLATTVVPPEELDDAVAGLVAAVTAPIHGAVAETKALLQSATRLDLEEQRLAERLAQVRRLRELAALIGR